MECPGNLQSRLRCLLCVPCGGGPGTHSARGARDEQATYVHFQAHGHWHVSCTSDLPDLCGYCVRCVSLRFRECEAVACARAEGMRESAAPRGLRMRPSREEPRAEGRRAEEERGGISEENDNIS